MANPFGGPKGQISRQQQSLQGAHILGAGQQKAPTQDEIAAEISGRVNVQVFAEQLHAEATNRILEESYEKFVYRLRVEPLANCFAISSHPPSIYVGGKYQVFQNPEFLFLGQAVVEFGEAMEGSEDRYFGREILISMKYIEAAVALTVLPVWWKDRFKFKPWENVVVWGLAQGQ